MGRGTPATPRDSISRAQVASIEAPALAETNQRVFLGTGCFAPPVTAGRTSRTDRSALASMPHPCRYWPCSFVLKGSSGRANMQYAILCYHDERVTSAWSKEHDDAVIAKLGVVREKLVRQGKLGPVARLLPTTAATTLRKDREPPLVIDGPFAETKEQLLGFYIVDCAGLDEVIGIAKELGAANPGGAYEIRPVATFDPGKVAS